MCVSVCAFCHLAHKNDKVSQTNKRKCSSHGHSKIAASTVLRECMKPCVSQGVGWVEGDDWIQWEERTKAENK